MLAHRRRPAVAARLSLNYLFIYCFRCVDSVPRIILCLARRLSALSVARVY